jgi:protein TonB
MGYQALLFCPDEKLAKVVSQVFSELDFTVEPVHEPFAAVKKLMAQRYDAIVVDCENEQNASLLFKSARNSSFNQSSLAIALVLGQAGVAKAYRIGANLVLTKPINVEQAKGTLRVARGLLRKNSDAAAAATASTPTPAPPKPAPAPVSSSQQPPARPTAPPAPPIVRREVPEFEPPVSVTPAILPAMAASMEIEDVLAALPAPVLQTPAPQTPPVHVPEPVVEARQPFLPGAVKSPVDDIVKNDAVHSLLNRTPARTLASPSPAQNPSSLFSTPGSAAAAAPAREISAPPAREATTKAAEKPLEVLPVAPVWESGPEAHAAATAFDSTSTVDGPSFAAFGEGDEESGSKKKIIIIAVALLAVIVIGYLGYEQWGKPASTTPASHPVSATQSSGEPAPILAPMPAPEPMTSTSTGSRTSSATPASNSKPAAASALDKSSAATNSPVIKIDATPEPETKQPVAAPIVVKSNAGGAKKPPQADEAAPALPSTVASANDASLNGLISSTDSSVARPALATVKVSQGVSQGLVIKRVQPKYPPAALATHASGVVQIEATISKDGTVTNVKVFSGDPMLARAAVDAVRQWRYKPYYLDGEPVEIQTQITVNFKPN